MNLQDLAHNALSDLHYPLDENALRAMPNPIGMLFGHVRKDKHGKPVAHQGWDLASPPGRPVYALTDGAVWWTRAEKGGYGKHMLASFTFGSTRLFALYAHLTDFIVRGHPKQPTKVSRGDALGITGCTGNADIKSPHLHFEIRTTSALLGHGLPGRVDPGEFFPELLKLPVQRACFL